MLLRLKLVVLGLVSVLALSACNFQCSLTTSKLSDISTYKDSAHTQKTSKFGTEDTIYAKTATELNISEAEVEWQLIAKKVQGVNPGMPVPPSRVIQKVIGNEPAKYWVSSPDNGWPVGEYTLEAVLKQDGQVVDRKSVDLTVSE